MDRRTVRGRTKSVMKTIGIVAEGPRDFELIAAVIDTITNEDSLEMVGKVSGNGVKTIRES